MWGLVDGLARGLVGFEAFGDHGAKSTIFNAGEGRADGHAEAGEGSEDAGPDFAAGAAEAGDGAAGDEVGSLHVLAAFLGDEPGDAAAAGDGGLGGLDFVEELGAGADGVDGGDVDAGGGEFELHGAADVDLGGFGGGVGTVIRNGELAEAGGADEDVA